MYQRLQKWIKSVVTLNSSRPSLLDRAIGFLVLTLHFLAHMNRKPTMSLLNRKIIIHQRRIREY